MNMRLDDFFNLQFFIENWYISIPIVFIFLVVLFEQDFRLEFLVQAVW